mmetsp:Transcript_76964/g.223459  ORF Transcript_76964/g.223459 Transcript_76964/m.223459 type:complete len:113 (-) Transcript_76964:102-440(-)|eukprot:CAMPEP_0176089424 /NCGR_PEP_ID=MMETSP0120_2-20121206/44786_1 /TAXON_ID=160619 /ORGANISM="Kryptoperidinium foliaceum, Strain CCMP 1326" /LENGTH=112 /DNA_ID=CAMNT_0017423305 /DNA_START=101 /DNA_END=439 /DNA_ORIENTATION=+
MNSVRPSILLGACLFLIVSLQLQDADAFAPVAPMMQHRQQRIPTKQYMFEPSSSMDLSAATLDPTTILSDILGGLLGTPAILLVPIVAALGVASLIAFFIVSYANPEVEDDE